MIVAGITVAVLFGFNLLGLLISLPLDRDGVPAAYNGQFVQRRPGTLKKRLPLIVFNLGLLTVSAFPPLYFFSDLFSLEAPPIWAFALQFLVLVFFDDLWFYIVHRIIHENRFLYKHIHKKHHEAYAPVPIEYLYVHPLEWMAGGVGPAIAIMLIIGIGGGMSAWTLWVWGAWRIIHELDIHSGIAAQLTRIVPLFAGTEHHDLHHARPNMGNYASSMTLWDKVFKTEIDRAQVKRARARS
jgi:sterol desaturase/sphingolipid hydroxylase (fatty acid hydroxylase superfamily)